MNRDLFDIPSEDKDASPAKEQLSSGTALLRHFATGISAGLLEAIETVFSHSPLRQMSTPGNLPMSVTLSNCGDYGWISDRYGYRYEKQDPVTQQPWPVMPAILKNLAERAAIEAGFPGFSPDTCLINCYVPGAKMGLHQDKDERDFNAPIISVSLGLPAIFLLGGMQRSDKTRRLPLYHGDVLVWGGADRLRFHGVMPLLDGQHEWLDHCRINLTFRKAM